MKPSTPLPDIPPIIRTTNMGYQRGSPRGARAHRGFDRSKKAKTKKSTTNHIAEPRRIWSNTQPQDEVLIRALAALENLGSQTFAMPPYYQHYDRWLKSLQTVLDDFEASKTITIDETFKEDITLIIFNVTTALKAAQTKEASIEAAILNLHGSREFLSKAEQEHSAKLKKLSEGWESKLSSLTKNVEVKKRELEEVTQSKASIFEGITKAKARSEGEKKTSLTAAEKELADANETFVTEKASLNNENDCSLAIIKEQIATDKLEIERLKADVDKDASMEARRVATEEIAEAVKTFLARYESMAKKTN